MGKYSKICECGECFKNKQALANHKRSCSGIPTSRFKICQFCRRNFPKNRIQQHELSCEKYIFFHRYGHFLDFIYKLIILYNKKNNKNKYARFANEKKYFIKNIKLKNCKNDEEIKQVEKEYKNDKDYIKNNMPLLKEYYNNEKIKIDNILKDCRIDVNKVNDKFAEVINTVIQSENIDISFRDLVIDYFKSKIYADNRAHKTNNKFNGKIYLKILSKYNKDDFFTYQEIKNFNKTLLIKVSDLRERSSEYQRQYQYFFNLLEEFDLGHADKFYCVFCNRYYLHKWQHFRKCFWLKQNYNDSVWNTFFKFINSNFDEKILNRIIPEQIVRHYLDKDFLYFVDNIRDNIESPETFQEIKIGYRYHLKKVKISNKYLEKYLNILYKKIYKEYEIELNIRQKRYLREVSVNYYLKNGAFDTKKIIKKFKRQYNKEINVKKNIEENERIINLFEDKKNPNERLAPNSVHESEDEESEEKIDKNVQRKMQKIISEMQKKKEKNEISKKYSFNIKYINTFNYINK